MGSVPIYLGAPNVDDYAPGEHCFINVRDYDSPKHLAEYLQELLENPEAYNAYFDWKRKPYKVGFQQLLRRVRKPLALRFVEAIEHYSSKLK